MKIKNNKGITMVILVFTVIILAVLASTVTIASRDSIEFTKKTRFISELKVIREKANIIKKEMAIGSSTYDGIGQAVSSSGNSAEIENAFVGAHVTSDGEKENYKFFNIVDLNALGIYDINQRVLINFDNLNVISVDGLEINKQKYYTIESVEETI